MCPRFLLWESLLIRIQRLNLKIKTRLTHLTRDPAPIKIFIIHTEKWRAEIKNLTTLIKVESIKIARWAYPIVIKNLTNLKT